MSTGKTGSPIDWVHEKEWLGSLLSRIVLRPQTRIAGASRPSGEPPELAVRRSSRFFGLSVIEMCAEGCTTEDLLELESLFEEAFG